MYMYMYSYTSLKMSLFFCFKKVILNNLFSLFFFFLLEWGWVGIERWPCIGTELQFGHLRFGGGGGWNVIHRKNGTVVLRSNMTQYYITYGYKAFLFVESLSITKFDQKRQKFKCHNSEPS